MLRKAMHGQSKNFSREKKIFKYQTEIIEPKNIITVLQIRGVQQQTRLSGYKVWKTQRQDSGKKKENKRVKIA